MKFMAGKCEKFDLEKAKVTLGKDQQGLTVATVTCENPKHYALIGDEKVTCVADETWSTKPECRKCGKTYFYIVAFKIKF